MIFHTSRLYFARMVLLGSGMAAAAYIVAAIADEGESFQRILGYIGIVFFGASALLSVAMLVAKPKTIELTDTGLSYSDWPDQIIQWSDLKNVHAGFLASCITLKFKNKHHTIFFRYPPRRPLLGREPKDGELTISLLRFAEKARPKIQAQVIARWSAVYAGPQIKQTMDKYSDLIDQAYESIVEKIAEEEGLDPDDLFDKLDEQIEGHTEEIIGFLVNKNGGYKAFEGFVRSLHRQRSEKGTATKHNVLDSEIGSNTAQTQGLQKKSQPFSQQGLGNSQPVGDYGARKRR